MPAEILVYLLMHPAPDTGYLCTWNHRPIHYYLSKPLSSWLFPCCGIDNLRSFAFSFGRSTEIVAFTSGLHLHSLRKTCNLGFEAAVVQRRRTKLLAGHDGLDFRLFHASILSLCRLNSYTPFLKPHKL